MNCLARDFIYEEFNQNDILYGVNERPRHLYILLEGDLEILRMKNEKEIEE
jgi:hypothetical protein